MTPAERVRYDAAINRVIQDVEAKYGMRPPRVPEPGEAAVAGPAHRRGDRQGDRVVLCPQTSAGRGPSQPSPVRRAGVPSRHRCPARTAAVPIRAATGPAGKLWRIMSRLTYNSQRGMRPDDLPRLTSRGSCARRVAPGPSRQ